MKQHINNGQINSAANQSEVSPKWYKVGMVWLMLALPLTAVVASLTTVSIAYKNKPQIVAAPQSQAHAVEQASEK